MKTLEQNVPGIHRSILTKRVLLILFIFIVGCSHLPDSMPTMDFATENLNSKLQLSAPPDWNNYDANNSVSLLVQNISNDQVVFPKDFNIRIYTYTDEKWVEIRNISEYIGDDVVLFLRSDTSLGETGVGFFPYLFGYKTPIELRIFVFGQIYKNDKATNEWIGAYIDVTLK